MSQDYDLSQDYKDIQGQEGQEHGQFFSQEHGQFFSQEDDQFFVSDFYQNSVEMYLPCPEDLDEMGESSSAAVS